MGEESARRHGLSSVGGELGWRSIIPEVEMSLKLQETRQLRAITRFLARASVRPDEGVRESVRKTKLPVYHASA